MRLVNLTTRPIAVTLPTGKVINLGANAFVIITLKEAQDVQASKSLAPLLQNKTLVLETDNGAPAAESYAAMQERNAGQSQARMVIADAKVEAQNLIGSAKAEAAQILADAQAEAQKRLDHANAFVEALKAGTDKTPAADEAGNPEGANGSNN